MEVKANGISLYYEVTGTSGTPIILLHGNGEDHHIFDKIVPKLSSNFTVYAIDSRNQGQSEKTGVYAYQTMADDVYAFIKTLHLDKVNIIGFSDGAIISLTLAMNHGQVIRKMALLGVNLSPADFKDECYQYVNDTYSETKDPMFKLMLEQPHIALDDIRSVLTPTLVVAADDDIYKPETFVDVANALPNAELKIMTEHDHGSYIINQDIMYDDFIRFFE